MSYPKKQWYVGATSDEVGRSLMERRILGESVVFFRSEAGAPVALAGLCPHRSYPMALGRLKGDAVECGYHGITFDCTGQCIRVPSQDKPSRGLKLRRFPVHELGSWIWIWMGDTDSADISTIPDLSRAGIGVSGFRHELNPVCRLPARYQLLLDNLMDLSHISFIHAATVPDGGYIANAKVDIEEHNGVISVRRDFNSLPCDGFTKFLHPDIEGLIDYSLTSDYFGPCLINAGGPYVRKPGEHLTRYMNFLHAMTPETATSTHYFSGISRNFALDNDALSAQLLAQNRAVIAEDVAALGILETRIQANVCPLKEVSVLGDVGALRVRKALAEQIAAESSRTPTRGKQTSTENSIA
jgi:vanillate O-demethylase monooxygenase subunit